MPLIHLTIFIAAPSERVFNLSRSINLHKMSMLHYAEEAINGRTSGLIEINESVTWKARHLGRVRYLKLRVTAMQAPYYFTDEQVQGDFKRMKHEHFFKPCDNGTIMIDQFYFESPYGLLGKWFDFLFLTGYLRRLLEKRNQQIKEAAESSKWKHYLIER